MATIFCFLFLCFGFGFFLSSITIIIITIFLLFLLHIVIIIIIVVRKKRCYIAAQSPYDDRTAVDFWRLIHQKTIKTVVMVGNTVEDSVVKCTQFWPKEGETERER